MGVFVFTDAVVVERCNGCEVKTAGGAEVAAMGDHAPPPGSQSVLLKRPQVVDPASTMTPHFFNR